jgi:hypothetical protein
MKTELLKTITLITVVFLTVGCSLGSFAAPTPTAVPTNTPIPPTNTPLPTDTPTPLPTATATATPNLAATASFKATQTAEALVTDIKAQLTDLKLPTDGTLGWYQTEPASVELDGYQDWGYLSFAEDLEVSDFIINTDITWESTGWPTCGLWFRSDKDFGSGKFYWFEILRLSGLPGWDISFYRDSKNYVNTPTDFRTSGALDLGSGATNKVIIMAQAEKFVVYFNGQRQGQFFDYSKQSLKGYFAFAGWQDSGSTTCTYENTWVWLLK